MLNALLPLALLAASGPMTPAPAQADFTFDRSELATQHGSEAVYARIHNVAEQVCAEENSNGVMEAYGTRICIADTVARTIADINAPTLSHIHAQRSVSPDQSPRAILVATRD